MTATPHKTRWAWAVSTFFGIGLLRPGPGTYGSAAAVLLWYAAAHVLQPDTSTLAVSTAAAALLVTLAGIPAATRTAREAGREDPGFVIIDEVAGQLVALLGMRPDWKHAALAFVLFRLFDITKPPPVRRLEDLPEGSGIMLDDVAAGIYALALAHIIFALAHSLH